MNLGQGSLGFTGQDNAAATVADANNGVSLDGSTVVLGGNTSSLSGKLLSNREIPMNGKTISFTNPNLSDLSKIQIQPDAFLLIEKIAYPPVSDSQGDGPTIFFNNPQSHNGFRIYFDETGLQFLSTNGTNVAMSLDHNSGNALFGGGNIPVNTAGSVQSTASIADGICFEAKGLTNTNKIGFHATLSDQAFALQFSNGGIGTYSVQSIEGSGTFYQWVINANYIIEHRGLGYFHINTDGTTDIQLTPGGRLVTSKISLAAGTATAATSPLKFTAGTNNTVAETGAMEYDGTNLFFVRTGTTRESVITGNVAAATVVLDTANYVAVNINGTNYKLALVN